MPIELRYRIVDVFTDRPLAGNALCVVLDPCPDAVMAAIAREVNLSETTFPVVTGDGTYEMRIFTPGAELPFAGHPSLGTAWCLGPGKWEQTTEGGTVVVEADASGAVMEQPVPRFTYADPDQGVQALGLPGAEAASVAEAGGLTHLLLATDAPLGHLTPENAMVEAASRASGAHDLVAFRRLDDETLHVRVFAPSLGIAEDAGTGSAAGPVALLARRLWGTAVDLTILQGGEIGRPCRIEVHAEEDDLRVGGRVAACADGRFTLPP
ncbi:MAG TPA: PhzF family phenazine biosynthesis protein [Acidimicrobiales bacterium]|nr:PhzF family phenazine biosynthesis protein [Acidimicrobiales bacterium]